MNKGIASFARQPGFSFPLGVVRENGRNGNAHIHSFSFPLGVVRLIMSIKSSSKLSFSFPLGVVSTQFVKKRRM